MLFFVGVVLLPQRIALEEQAAADKAALAALAAQKAAEAERLQQEKEAAAAAKRRADEAARKVCCKLQHQQQAGRLASRIPRCSTKGGCALVLSVHASCVTCGSHGHKPQLSTGCPLVHSRVGTMRHRCSACGLLHFSHCV